MLKPCDVRRGRYRVEETMVDNGSFNGFLLDWWVDEGPETLLVWTEDGGVEISRNDGRRLLLRHTRFLKPVCYSVMTVEDDGTLRG